MGRKSSLKRKRRMSRNRGTAVAPAAPSPPPPTTRAHLGTSGYWVPEDAKLSTRLGQVAQVLIDELPDDAPFDAKRTAYEFAAVAWNYDVTGDLGRAAEDFVEGGVGPEMYGLVELIAEWKRSLFPEDRRLIVNLSIREGLDDTAFVEVASAR